MQLCIIEMTDKKVSFFVRFQARSIYPLFWGDPALSGSFIENNLFVKGSFEHDCISLYSVNVRVFNNVM